MSPVILDVRTRSQYGKDQRLIPNAIRVRPDEVEEWARTWVEEHPKSQVEGRRIVTYCT